MKHTIFIAGAGGIGEAVALLLRAWSEFEVELVLGDIDLGNLLKAKKFVEQNSQKTASVETVLMGKEDLTEAMKVSFENCDVLLDCSPGSA